jgi:DNA-binding protein YbaB
MLEQVQKMQADMQAAQQELEDLVVAAVTEAARRAKVLQREKFGAATSGLDLGSLGLGGLDGLFG